MPDEPTLTTAERLNLETARVDWPELERHFARGALLHVAPSLDLIDVATALVDDAADRVADWRADGLVVPASDSDARRWHEAGAALWAVVVAPFVLVQESKAD